MTWSTFSSPHFVEEETEPREGKRLSQGHTAVNGKAGIPALVFDGSRVVSTLYKPSKLQSWGTLSTLPPYAGIVKNCGGANCQMMVTHQCRKAAVCLSWMPR